MEKPDDMLSLEENIKRIDEFKKKLIEEKSVKSGKTSTDRAWFWFCTLSISFVLYMLVMWLLINFHPSSN
jgi:hypothetical protein